MITAQGYKKLVNEKFNKSQTYLLDSFFSQKNSKTVCFLIKLFTMDFKCVNIRNIIICNRMIITTTTMYGCNSVLKHT